MPDLFLSHATKDDEAINGLSDVLETCGLSVWVDHRHGIEPGNSNWDRTIRSAIRESIAGVLVMSPRSLASDICSAECLLVRDLGKPLYVAYLDTCKPEEIWLFIRMIQYADLRTDMAAGVEKLVKVIGGTKGADLPTAILSKVTNSDVMRVNLPYLNTVPLIGRDTDLIAIRALLGSHVAQLIAVGGTGKTRMAAEIALAYPTGAIWHRCGETTAAYQITEGIRRHFGFDEKLKEDEILNALEGKSLPLVVVDNAEVIDPKTPARASYVEMMGKMIAHGLPVLLTARAVWDELKPRRDYQPDPISEEAAAAMTLEFAKAEGVPLATNDAASLAEACHQHPRLIEFAVRQLHERDVQTVIRQVHDLKHHDVQETLDEMILQAVRQMAAQAWNGQQAADLLACLTVTRGAFDSVAALALKPDNMDADAVEDASVTLQRWGFLRRDPSGGRYRIDEVVTGAVAPADGAVARHFAYYFGLHGNYDANNNEDRHPQILADWSNIRSALEWGSVQRPKQAIDWVWALRHYMDMRLSRSEWRSVLASSKCALEGMNYPLGEANTQRALGDIAYAESDYPTARTSYDKAMSLYQATGYQVHQANTYQALGDVARMQGDYLTARVAYDAAMSLYQLSDEWLGQANTQKALGDLAYAEGDYPTARAAYDAAMSFYQTSSDRLGQANTYRSLGDVARMQGDYPTARAAYDAAMLRYQASGSRLGQANTHHALGVLAYIQNNYTSARESYRQALILGTEVGDYVSRLNSLEGLAQIERAEGMQGLACDYYRQLMALAGSHPAFANHLVIESWRQEFADLNCE